MTQLARLPSSLRKILIASFVSYLGSGLTLPFLFIYLHQVRGIGIGLTGFLIAGTAALALVGGPLAGTVIDRLGPRAVAIGTIGVGVLGNASLVFVRSPISALVPMVLFGFSQAAWPAWNALLAVIVPEEDRPRVFALNFQLLNLGLGIGAVVAGIVVHAADPNSFVTIYLIDAGSDLAILVTLLLLPATALRAVTAKGAPDEVFEASLLETDPYGGTGALTEVATTPVGTGGYREVLSDARMVRYLIVAVVIGVAGYGAVNTGAIGYATTVLHASPRVIAWGFGANTAFIVLCQPFGLRHAERMRRTTALRFVAFFFGASWAILLVAGQWPSTALASVLVVVAFTVFAMGEVLFSPVFAPLVNDLASPELSGRYNALSSTTFSMAAVISPAIAGPMLGASLGREYLLFLLGCCVAAAAGFAWLRRCLTPEQDRAPEAVRELTPEPALD